MSNWICPKGEFIIYTIKIPPAVSFLCDGTARQFLSKVGGSPFMPFIPLSFLAQQPSCPSSLPLLFCSNPSYLVVQPFLTSLDVCNYSPHQFPLHAVAPTGLFRVRCRIQLLLQLFPIPCWVENSICNGTWDPPVYSNIPKHTLSSEWLECPSLDHILTSLCLILVSEGISALCPTCQFAPTLLDTAPVTFSEIFLVSTRLGLVPIVSVVPESLFNYNILHPLLFISASHVLHFTTGQVSVNSLHNTSP